jgi:hypothetical protein
MVRQLSGSGEGPGTGRGAAGLPETGREVVARTRASRCHQPGRPRLCGCCRDAGQKLTAPSPARCGRSRGELQAKPGRPVRARPQGTGTSRRSRPAKEWDSRTTHTPWSRPATALPTAADSNRDSNNSHQQRPATTHNALAIYANWGYVRPEKQTVEDQRRSAATVAKTVAKPLNSTRRTWTLWNIGPAHRPQRTVLDGLPTPTDQPLVPLARRRTGVKNGGGTARDVVSFLVRSRPRISLTPGAGLPRGRSLSLRARGLDSSARPPVPRAVPPSRLTVLKGEVR